MASFSIRSRIPIPTAWFPSASRSRRSPQTRPMSRRCRRPSTRTSSGARRSRISARSISAIATSPAATCPERVFTALLLDDLFPVIGMRPALGRGFTQRGARRRTVRRAAIISHRLWQSRFGGDPDILSRIIRIGGEATSIVGVMPPGLVLIGTDLWIPWGGDPVDDAAKHQAVHDPRPARARRDARAGERGALDDRRTGPAVVRGSVQGIRRMAADRHAVGRRAAPGRSAGGVHPARRRGLRPAHRLREPHEPDAGAIDHAGTASSPSASRSARPDGASPGSC